MSELTLQVQPREEKGKNSNRQLRAKGMVPIQVEKRTLLNLMRSTEGHNPVFLLQLAGTDKSRHAMIREMQVHPVTRHVLHVDFQRVVMTEKVRVAVHVELLGIPVGVKVDAGILDFVTREVHVECTPDKIPAKLSVDVSELHIGQHLEAKDLELPEGVHLTDEPGRVIASVSHSRAAEAVAATEEALIETEAVQPEVIKRGKTTEEE
jgi:large subunit ribosomal protein L25